MCSNNSNFYKQTKKHFIRDKNEWEKSIINNKNPSVLLVCA